MSKGERTWLRKMRDDGGVWIAQYGSVPRPVSALVKKGYAKLSPKTGWSGGGDWHYLITQEGRQALAIIDAAKGRKVPTRTRVKYKRAPKYVTLNGHVFKV